MAAGFRIEPRQGSESAAKSSRGECVVGREPASPSGDSDAPNTLRRTRFVVRSHLRRPVHGRPNRAWYRHNGTCSALLEPIPALSFINIAEPRAAQPRLPAVPPLSRTASATMRYWNIARQRHYRSSARCCWTLRVSVDRAARPSPHTRGKPRLLDVGRRILARDRFAPDSPLLDQLTLDLYLPFGSIRPIALVFDVLAQHLDGL
jgi:hypothetical protein